MQYIVLGIALIIFGFLIIINPVFYDDLYGFEFNFSGYNIPLGIAMILAGVGFIWTSWTSRKKRSDKKNEK